MTTSVIARSSRTLSTEGHIKSDKKMVRILDELNKSSLKVGKSKRMEGAFNLVFIIVLLVISIFVAIASVLRG